jgi:hypothetical protein
MDEETNVVPFPRDPLLPGEMQITLPLTIEGARFALEQLAAIVLYALAILDRAPQHGDEKVLRATWRFFETANYRTETEGTAAPA